MYKFLSVVMMFGLTLIVIPPVTAMPIYTTADFSGSISTVTGLGNSLGLQQTDTCSGCAGGSVSGHVSFDNSLIPASATGIVNVALTSFAGASDDSIFHIMFGSQPLGFAFGDLHVLGGPSIQFKNGVFNGFLLVEDFIVNDKTYELSMQGGSWTMNWLKNNGSSDLVASGYITTGSQGLVIQEYFNPAQPPLPATAISEPPSLALLGLALCCLIIVRYRFHRFAIARTRLQQF
jgi:hypothetical protein